MFIEKLKKIIFHYDWEIVEVQGAIFKVMWGIWLLLPMHTFTQAVYTPLTALANENSWGVFVLLLGSLHLCAIAYGRVKQRRIAIFVAMMFWIFSSVAFALARVGSALIPLTIVIAFFLAVNYIRLGAPTIISRYLGHHE